MNFQAIVFKMLKAIGPFFTFSGDTSNNYEIVIKKKKKKKNGFQRKIAISVHGDCPIFFNQFPHLDI